MAKVVANSRPNELTKKELNAEMRLSSMTNAQTGSKIAKLQEKGTFYSKQIGVEAKKLQDLDKEIEIVEAMINNKREKLRKAEGNTTESLSKDIKKVDKTLNKTLQRHNEILSDNKQLKDEIDRLRREKVTFDKIYKKLENELQDKKKVLGDVFESSEKAKERKKKIEDQIKILKLRVQREESNIEKEFQDIFKDINEKNVVDRIEEKFGTFDQRISPTKKKENPAKNNNMIDDYNEDISRMSFQKGFRNTEKKFREFNGKTPQEEVEEYNAVFDSLRKKTNKADLKDILALFEDYETKNYSLYQHLAHLSDEKETIEKQIQEVKQEMSNLARSQQNGNSENGIDNKAQKIQELKHEIEDSDTHVKFLGTKQTGLIETINALKISIPVIFERIGCNTEDYANDLLDGSIVNEGNMLQYLGIIEKKTNEILQMYHFSQNKTDAVNKLGPQGKISDDANISVNAAFPQDLLSELANAAAPERADMLSAQDFEDDANRRVNLRLKKPQVNQEKHK